jgi:competence ComEA-like helix-hairpin-helix protein
MPLTLPPAARERRRASVRLLERVLLFLILWRLGGALGETLVPAPRACGPPPPLRIDVAHDPAWRLEHLPGIGPARARAIVREREAHGPPRRLEDLLRIQGIGPGRLEAFRTALDVHVILDGAPVASPSPGSPR